MNTPQGVVANVMDNNIVESEFEVHYIHIYPTPPLTQDMTQGQFLSGV